MAKTGVAMSLGEVIREARVSKGSLREFAKSLNMSPSYMSDIENDRRTPSEDTLKKIADLLNLNFDDLMGRAGRLGDEAERYIRRHPIAGILFRRIVEADLNAASLLVLLREAQELARG